jgi:hypothetical protein
LDRQNRASMARIHGSFRFLRTKKSFAVADARLLFRV